MTITGRITEVMPVMVGKSASGNEWKKQEFLIDTGDKYNPNLVLSLFGKSLDNNAQYLVVGSQVEIDFNLSSTKFEKNGKTMWFTNVNAYAIRPSMGATQQPPAHINPYEQAMSVYPAHPAQQVPPATVGQTDDLPF